MDAEEAASFSSTVDWTTTFVIPLPRYEVDYEEVSVDGTTGTLLMENRYYGDQYVLMWVKNGMVYALSGAGGKNEALKLANSIQ
jgi:hypothetical protein